MDLGGDYVLEVLASSFVQITTPDVASAAPGGLPAILSLPF